MTVDAGILPDIDIIPEPVDRIAAVVGSEGFWKRFGVISAGIALTIIGTVIAVSGTRAVKDATKLVTGVASKVVTKGMV